MAKAKDIIKSDPSHTANEADSDQVKFRLPEVRSIKLTFLQ
jgi:hypothetical protein